MCASIGYNKIDIFNSGTNKRKMVARNFMGFKILI